LNIFENSLSFEHEKRYVIKCINCQLNFYNQGKLVKSCNDILQFSITNIQSFFQFIPSNFISTTDINLIYSEYKIPLCPLVFKSGYIIDLTINKLTNTFYKKRLFEISNETFDSLNSTILQLYLEKVENIDIDSKMLNPSVFSSLTMIKIAGFVNSIRWN